jgi:hypothetical protein
MDNCTHGDIEVGLTEDTYALIWHCNNCHSDLEELSEREQLVYRRLEREKKKLSMWLWQTRLEVKDLKEQLATVQKTEMANWM